MQIESLHLRETNFASKWLFTDSFTAGFKEKCRQFSPLWKYIFVEGGGEISRDFHFHSKLIEESIWKFQRGMYNPNIKSSFERKLFNTFYSSITRGSKRSRRSSLLLFCRFGSKGIAFFCERIRRNFIHRGTLSWLNFTGTGSSDHATRQVNRARDKTSRRD